ncbi:MAG: hypothetical protein A3E19_03065 [Planctomycetes bacterium RIFCSPHIGHO2_12_FULL_52_36]|nr:MAG: hypothetical protein A3D89_00040 [Planctomycetes bacterium RIFCSPHIGHO2_02_FULL_52_58]OHB94306.1 MAG: hypothetical protein A3E19_03065 [Planctomycetes bacterium RIFCSPHIGHO2_12_FULL_52_36]
MTIIRREDVAHKLEDYLHQRLTLAELVDWAEKVMQEGIFDESDLEMLRDIVSRLGLADVRTFGLTWEDCSNYLTRLGYRVNVEVSPPH